MINLLLKLIKKDLLMIVRHRGALIASLCLPFLLYGIFSFSFSNMMDRHADISKLQVAVVDKENSTLSKMLINNFKGDKSFSDLISIDVMDEETALNKFMNNELTGFIIIPEKFSRSLINIENYPIKVCLNAKDPLKSSVLKNMLQSYGIYISSVEKSLVSMIDYLRQEGIDDKKLESINEKASIDLVLTALSRDSIFKAESMDSIPKSSSQEYFILGIIVMLVMYNSVSAGSNLIEESASGTLRRVTFAPNSEILFPIAKVLAYSLYNFILTSIFVVPLAIYAKIDDFQVIFHILFVMFLAIVFLNSLFICLASFFRERNQYVMLGNILVFIFCLTGGSFLPLQLMPAYIQNLAAFTPNFWIIKCGIYVLNYFPLSSLKNILAAAFGISILLSFISALSTVRRA